MGGTPRPVLCIGESLVVLICERPGGIVRGGDAFVPHVGGAATNVAVHAAGGAPPVALAGGAGDDLWSRRLQRRLREEASRSRLLAPARRNGDSRRVRRPRPGRRARVPDLRRWHRSGHGRAWTGLDEAVGAASSLVLGSNAMLGRRKRLSLRARTLALARGAHVLFDWNLRLHRWRDAAEAINLARLMCEGALLIKLNVDEATLLTGESDP